MIFKILVGSQILVHDVGIYPSEATQRFCFKSDFFFFVSISKRSVATSIARINQLRLPYHHCAHQLDDLRHLNLLLLTPPAPFLSIPLHYSPSYSRLGGLHTKRHGGRQAVLPSSRPAVGAEFWCQVIQRV